MKQYLLLLILLFLFLEKTKSQNGLLSGDSCASAPIIHPLNGYGNSLPFLNYIDQPTTFCGSIQSNQWIAFIAGSEELKIEISIIECSGTADPPQLQAHAYSVCENPWTPVSNCIYQIWPNDSEELNFNNLIPGNVYKIMIDGDCSYSFEVLNGFTQSCDFSQVANAGEDVYLNCSNNSSIILDASNSILSANSTGKWFDENYEYLGNEFQISIEETGSYIYAIENDSSNCVLTDMVQVFDFQEIIEIETEAFFTTGMPDSMFFLDVISVNSLDSNLLFSWSTSDGNIISGGDSISPLISSSGIYQVNVVDTILGCSLTNFVNVTVESTSVFFPSKNQIKVDVIPNVTNDLLNIQLILEKASQLNFQLFNSKGIAVQEINFRKKQNGEHRFEMSLKDLPAGVYFILIKTEEGNAVKRVVKI